jgi:hypothetical protein
MSSGLRKLFSESSLEELCGPQKILILKDSATVEQALRVSRESQGLDLLLVLPRVLRPVAAPADHPFRPHGSVHASFTVCCAALEQCGLPGSPTTTPCTLLSCCCRRSPPNTSCQPQLLPLARSQHQRYTDSLLPQHIRQQQSGTLMQQATTSSPPPQQQR